VRIAPAKLAKALLWAIAVGMCALGVWAFVADPMVYARGPDADGGGVSRLFGAPVVPILAAAVAVFALRSLKNGEEK
jgi:hypothetical protein